MGDASMSERGELRTFDVTEYLRSHGARGYYLKRNAIVVILAFLYVTTLAGIYRFDLWLLTPLFLTALVAYAVLKRQYHRFRDKRHYFLASAGIDNVAVTVALYLFGGTGSAQIFTFYMYPIIYHSLIRSRSQIFVVANMAAVMCASMMALEAVEILPQRDVFGFGRPYQSSYLGLILGVFLMLNLAALVCDAVTRVFAKIAQELWEAKEGLEESQRELRRITGETEFVARAISHELKSPLSAAANAIELLIEESASGRPDDVRELGGIVHQNVTKAYDMLTQLRDVLVAANAQEAIHEISMGTVFRDVLAEIDSVVHARGVEIRLPTMLPEVTGQPQKIAQVVRNLLLNAIEHGAARDECRSTVTIEFDAGNDDEIIFSVADSGAGIPLEHRERIFEPFVTLGCIGRGRGLGLALAKRVVEEARGRIWVEEAAGGGARFVFTLPQSSPRGGACR